MAPFLEHLRPHRFKGRRCRGGDGRNPNEVQPVSRIDGSRPSAWRELEYGVRKPFSEETRDSLPVQVEELRFERDRITNRRRIGGNRDRGQHSSGVGGGVRPIIGAEVDLLEAHMRRCQEAVAFVA